MPVNTDIQIPFLPQQSITNSILTAIQLANENHRYQQQLALQQQQLAQQAPLTQAQTGLATAQTGVAGATQKDIEQQIQQRQIENEARQRAMEYVFGAGTGGGANPDLAGQPGATQQKPGLISDLANLKKGLGVQEGTPDAAQLDAAANSMKLNMVGGKFDDKPLQEAIKDIQDRQGKKDTDLSPSYRKEGNQWFKDMHTADGKLAYSVPTIPPAEYLAKSSEGVDYMRTVDQNTGKVTITPIEKHEITQPILPGQPAPRATVSSGTGLPKGPGGSFELPGAGKKLSEQGQATITGLTQATDMVQPALDFLKNPPSQTAWYTAVLKYKLGQDPGPGFTDAFQAIGLARAIATGPLLHGIRNRQIVKGIQEHLPDLTDSPALVAQKMKDLQPFWKKAMDEVYKTENVKPPAETSGGGLSPEAAAYLKSQGIQVPQ